MTSRPIYPTLGAIMTERADVPHTTARKRGTILMILAGAAVLAFIAVMIVIHVVNPASSTSQSPQDVYLSALTTPAQTNGDPLYAMAQTDTADAIALGNEACSIMRQDRLSDPTLYSDGQTLLKDVEYQLSSDQRWSSIFSVGDVQYNWDFDLAAGAAGRSGSLCPEFAAELGE